jgi:hypothetical protein
MVKAKKINITLSDKAVKELEERGNDVVLRNRKTKGERTIIFHK